ncbi:MAG: hypothetical protein JOY80_05680 [Candidatus Dormibacteraeota bacterium]|nr:hypothetical protein [Candidatus Dormibacteraeota bacterium]
MSLAVANIDVLRHGWEDALAAIAPNAPELSHLVETRLDDARREQRLDEKSLLAVAGEVADAAKRAVGANVALRLNRGLQRAVYEYLLSLDAIAPEEFSPRGRAEASVETDPARLIGVEEIRELEGLPTEEEPPTAIEQEEAPPPPPPPAPAADTEPPPQAAAETEPRKTRFRIFRGSGERTADAPPAPAPEPVAEVQLPNATEPSPPPPSPPVAQADDALGFVVAPREGFHLTEYDDLVSAGHESDSEMVTILDDEGHSKQVEAPQQPASGWRVRDRRADRHHESSHDLDVDSVVSMLDDDDSESRARFENDPDIIEARRQINDRLRKRRCDDAASLLQKLATELGGRAVAEMALDAGDRCRALGKANAALSCYLAASRADPVHEAPLLRLADICLDDRDIELAVSYLDRVARLHRLRGDTTGALRIYRKIATIAPYRDDILATLMRAQATGRFED